MTVMILAVADPLPYSLQKEGGLIIKEREKKGDEILLSSETCSLLKFSD